MPTLTAMGVDPGSRYCGIAVVRLTVAAPGDEIVRLEVRHRERVDASRLPQVEDRLTMIASRLLAVSREVVVDTLAVENVFAVRAGKESRGLGVNAGSDRMKEVPGMVRMLAQQLHPCPFWALMPATYRARLFGAGNSRGKTKADVRRVVCAVLGLDPVGLSFDESEACAIALAGGLEHLRTGLCIDCGSPPHGEGRRCCPDCWHGRCEVRGTGNGNQRKPRRVRLPRKGRAGRADFHAAR